MVGTGKDEIFLVALGIDNIIGRLRIQEAVAATSESGSKTY